MIAALLATRSTSGNRPRGYKTFFMLNSFVVVVLLFYVHGKHLRSCRDGQLT